MYMACTQSLQDHCMKWPKSTLMNILEYVKCCCISFSVGGGGADTLT